MDADATTPLGTSSEQAELRSTVRRFLDVHSPDEEVRRLADDEVGYDPIVWQRLGNELGLQGLIVPEDLGGAGGTFSDLCVALEEMGRSLLCAPFFSTVALAANLLLLAGDDAASETLPEIANAGLIATIAIVEPDGRWDPGAIRCSARGSFAGHRLQGEKAFVLDGMAADLLLVLARTGAGLGVFAVDASAEGVVRRAEASLDPTRRSARISFTDVPARQVAAHLDGWSLAQAAIDRAAVALAAEQVGGARRALESMVDYAKVRVQFARPIGSFQAIRHRCADALLAVESAASIVQFATAAASVDDPGLAPLANAAKAAASETYVKVALENIQIHGGLGFSWEHTAHLHYKRARSAALYLGDPTHHRRQLADRIGL